MPTATIMYPPTYDHVEWRERNANGLAPGRVPYGLDGLAGSAWSVGYSHGLPAGRNPRRWLGLPSAALARRRRPWPSADFALGWDERMAVPLLSTYGGSQLRLGAGVIWATDRLVQRTSRLLVRGYREVLRRLDVVWCLSTGQLPVLQSWLDLPPERVRYLPFGVDTTLFRHRSWPQSPLVLSLGNDRDRDVGTLFEALAEVRAHRDDVRVLVQSRSDRTPPPGVELLPTLGFAEALDLYAKASVVAVATHPNLHVSGMTVALEGMATGRPVVLSATPGANGYVIDSVTGYLVPPGDPEAHGAAIVRLLDDPARARSMGSAAREHVMARHSEASMCDNLSAILHDVAALPRS